MIENGFLNAEQIRAATFVRHIEIHDKLGSTNDRAAELTCDAHLELPALVVARHQTAGRGRGKHKWFSAEGALTFSILLEPAALGIQTANWPQLSLATAVAVCDALANELNGAHMQSTLGIKWPNDVILDGRKLCGILIESPGGAALAKKRLVIGIGININNSTALSDAVANGIALCDVSGRRHDLCIVLTRLLQTIETRLQQLSNRAGELPTAWQQLCLLTGKTVHIVTGRHRTGGVLIGLTDDGAALVETPAGQQPVFSGTIRAVN